MAAARRMASELLRTKHAAEDVLVAFVARLLEVRDARPLGSGRWLRVRSLGPYRIRPFTPRPAAWLSSAVPPAPRSHAPRRRGSHHPTLSAKSATAQEQSHAEHDTHE
jgi:hypothetical protein